MTQWGIDRVFMPWRRTRIVWRAVRERRWGLLAGWDEISRKSDRPHRVLVNRDYYGVRPKTPIFASNGRRKLTVGRFLRNRLLGAIQQHCGLRWLIITDQPVRFDRLVSTIPAHHIELAVRISIPGNIGRMSGLADCPHVGYRVLWVEPVQPDGPEWDRMSDYPGHGVDRVVLNGHQGGFDLALARRWIAWADHLRIPVTVLRLGPRPILKGTRLKISDNGQHTEEWPADLVRDDPDSRSVRERRGDG